MLSSAGMQPAPLRGRRQCPEGRAQLPDRRGNDMKLTVDRLSGVPYYLQVKEGVKGLIARGELQAGDMLATEFGLSEQLGISRLVVHRAYRELVTEGLLLRKRAKGTFVAPAVDRSYTVVGPLFGVTENMARYGMKPMNRMLVQEVIPASEEVKKELKLGKDARVVHLYNLRIVDGRPFSVEDTYLPAERFPGLSEMDLNDRSLYSTLESVYNALPQEA